MSFTPDAPRFLDENYVRNDKAWFKEHKQDYEQYVLAPFAQLLETVAPVIAAADSELVCTPRCISRIYRDARYVKGGAVFRNSVWCSIRKKRSSAYELVPEFYFYLTTEGFGYGCGYYRTSTAAMEQLRKMAISGDKIFKAAKKAFESQNKFYLAGEMYKKNHFPNEKPQLWDWLNRKSICACYDSADPNELFSDKLFDTVAKDFESITPMYKLYAEMERLAKLEDRKPGNIK